MLALAIFFGSLQALDFTNQRKKVVCRLRHPPPCGAPFMTHSEVRVTIHFHCGHKNLDTYWYILESWGRWHINPHYQSFLGMYDTCAKTEGKSSKN